ncbi:hypothetical protein M0802_002911 [Mischocyttarus mexicanus]|nr:hypothetical protein M0802_002911 [Mischocyttarus mexicanus]
MSAFFYLGRNNSIESGRYRKRKVLPGRIIGWTRPDYTVPYRTVPYRTRPDQSRPPRPFSFIPGHESRREHGYGYYRAAVTGTATELRRPCENERVRLGGSVGVRVEEYGAT